MRVRCSPAAVEQVAVSHNGPFAVDGKAAFRQGARVLFNQTESMTMTPINPQYRGIGTTGLVWSHNAFTVKPKDGPMQTTFIRFTATYAKIDGKWLVVAEHLSRIPSGD